MTPQWYIARQKQKHGPYPFEQLREWARSGVLLPTEMVLGDSGRWQEAGSVAGLFDLPVAAVAVPVTPTTATPTLTNSSTTPLAAILADPRKRVLCIAGATGALCLILLCGGVFALVRSLAKPNDQVAQVAPTTQNKSSKTTPGTLPTRPANDTPKESPKELPKEQPKDLPKELPKDLPRVAAPQQQRGNEASVQDFLRSEKARLDALHGFDKLDYTRGPKGERLEERLEEPGKAQGFIQQQGFVNAEGKFVAHGRRSQWFAKPFSDDRKVTEAWHYNGKFHGVVLWRYDKSFFVKALFVQVEGIRNGPFVSWDEKGVLRHEQSYKDGVRHGPSIWHSFEDGKVTFHFENGKLLFNRREKSKREFMALLKYAATSHSVGIAFPTFSRDEWRFRREVFVDWIGEPDRKVEDEVQSKKFPEAGWFGHYWYRCSDGVLDFKVNDRPSQDLVVLTQDHPG